MDLPKSQKRPALVERSSYQSKLPVEDFIVPLLKAEIEPVLEALPSDDSMYQILDVGCGGQPFRSIVEAKRLSYTSADAQDPLGIVDHIWELDSPVPPALLARAPFDFILCTEVLEHVGSWQPAFASFKKLLKPGGVMVITCPHIYVLHEEPFDFWRPTLYGIEHYALTFGFEVLELKKLGSSWDVLGTFLGANQNRVKALRPTLWNRSMAKLANSGFELLRSGLQRGFFQDRFSYFDDRYPFYLCNFARLRKPIFSAEVRPPS